MRRFSQRSGFAWRFPALPHRCTGTSSADPVSISVSAPAHVVIGSTFAYSIVVTYNGDLSGPSPEYTFTAALPSLVAYQGLVGPFPALCPTTPQSGQAGGTVVCTFGFSPDLKTITIPIKVRGGDHRLCRRKRTAFERAVGCRHDVD